MTTGEIVMVADLRTLEGWILTEGAPYLTLIVGALLAKRWRQLPFVALVTVSSIIAASAIYGHILYGDHVGRSLSFMLGSTYNLAAIAVVYINALLATLVVQGMKRAFIHWRVGYSS
jgi:hypothetical protein